MDHHLEGHPITSDDFEFSLSFAGDGEDDSLNRLGEDSIEEQSLTEESGPEVVSTALVTFF